jgi:8-oxo-dGTP diphosphatase
MSVERNCPNIACDAIIFNDRDELLVIKRGKEPFLGAYAFPCGYMDIGETAEECCVRELMEETGIKVDPSSLQLVGVYSDPKRDPRRHCVGLSYIGYVTGQEPIASDDAAHAEFVRDYDALPMAFDHAKILADALKIKRHDHAA